MKTENIKKNISDLSVRDKISRRYSFWMRPAQWYLNPKWWASMARMRKLREKHSGQRCFIIGNGPSLKKTDLSLLKNEVTFGLNRIYLMFDEMGYSTSYYISVNKLVIEQCAHDIIKLPCLKFIKWDTRNLINFTDDMMFLRYIGGPRFSTNITTGVWGGATVTYVAMQIAYYLGFQKVILIGVDHSFTTKGEPGAEVVSEGDDPNHFSPGYFGKGFRWHLPDLETSELAYRIARHAFMKAGREIVDATIDGQLQVFPKVNYYDMF